ncbi:relaxase/mobilization nuclease domain-containing protein [Chryseolinea sp. H1M3-3]|uniref:relaxase/mobilization nuclease domain-containing protein n=1 Tax=Chryseolinea sp. H1M3-3 TaxID=3034144 RepID=UPI0023EBBCCC|nr:relaxase/mobilization nuclease domain-containing protein [Chryseolinea sp. H1M3-3]
MTANLIKGKSFRGALKYNLDKVDKNVAEVLDHSFVKVSEKMILKEVQMVKMLRPNLKKYFYHTSINFPYNENLNNELMKEIGLEYLKASGSNQHQYIMFRHYDADHPHLHILVNRIGYDGQVMSDSNDYARCEKVLRELEKKYNLTQVISSKQAKERSMTKNELEMMKRTNMPSQKMAMQIILKNVLQSKYKMNTNEFISNLQAKGVDVLFNQASTGYVSGISYSYQGMIITGAKLGNDFKWSSIKNTISYEQERDRTTIYEANLRSKSTIDQLRADNEHAQGNRANAQQGNVKYGRLSDSAQTRGLFIFSPSFTARVIKEAVGQSERTAEGVVNAVFEIPKGISLATLLDSNPGRHHFVDNNQSTLGNLSVKKKPKKKKRRRLRL